MTINKTSKEETPNLAKACMHSPTLNAALLRILISSAENSKLALRDAVKVLEGATKEIEGGNLSRIREMYLSQAVSLDCLFIKLAVMAQENTGLKQYQALFNLALKAQAQSRATLQALVDLERPKSVVFMKQANIAHGHQQVNNDPSSNLKNRTEPNELLEEQFDGVDTRAQSATKKSHPPLEAMGKINRSQNRQRQSSER